MMEYWIPREPTFFEQEIKRSRFLAWIQPVSTVEEMHHCLHALSSQHPDARHICWAYIVGGPNSPRQKAQDDDEPAGTAGKPILNVLQHSNCGDIAAIVVRYFGGVKLGAGGLVRAYSSSASEALKITPLTKKESLIELHLSSDFAQENTLRHLSSLHRAEIKTVTYTDHVSFYLLIPASQQQQFLTSLPNTISVKS